MNISEIANKAADIIERNGLCKYALYFNSFAQELFGSEFAMGSHCARGAMIRAVSGTGAEWEDLRCGPEFDMYFKADCAFGEFVGKDTADWNNAPERTKEEVVQAFRDLAIKHQSDEYTEGN